MKKQTNYGMYDNTGLPSFKNGLECDYPRSTTERSEGPTERSEGVC